MKKEKSVEEKFRERPLVLRKRREKLKATANWPLFYYKFNQDHTLPNLLWNYKVHTIRCIRVLNHFCIIIDITVFDYSILFQILYTQS